MIELHEGDTRQLMAAMAPNSVHCCVTSPPYFQLRDYGVKGQIGLEHSIEAHIRTLTQVFNLVHRVLRADATLWLNYGDSYAEGGRGGSKADGLPWSRKRTGDFTGRRKRRPSGRIKSKDLIGMPWRLALALQAQGWWLRSCIIWEKPSCMPESAKDRPTVSHEYVFLLTKSRHYHYDGQAIAEPLAADTNARYARARTGGYAPPGQKPHNGYAVAPRDNYVGGPPVISANRKELAGPTYSRHRSSIPGGQSLEAYPGDTRNARTVWRIPAEPTSVAHFATFPTELVRRCLAAGCPVGGTAFDPFGGYGAVALVADRQQKHAILHELNPAYIELARKRLIAECPLLCEVKVYGAAAKPVRKRTRHLLGGDPQGDTRAGG